MASFPERLKQLRLGLDMSQSDLARSISVSTSTIGMYEQGRRMPTYEGLEEIADFFNVDLDYLMGKSDKTTLLDPTRLINVNNVEGLKKRLDLAYVKLNREGRTKLVEQGEMLVATGQFKSDEILPFSEDIGAYIMTIGSAAAGSGYENMDDLENYRLIMTTEVPEHDFVLDVEGDSMFPTIYDGDVAFVSKSFDNVSHRIYALTYDDKTVIKRLVFGDGELTLISDNPEYDERILSGTALESVRIEGEVVGWETPVI